MTESVSKNKINISASALRAYTMLGALVFIWLFFHWQTGSIFLTPRNLSNLMLQTSVTGIIAVGMLMVIVSGNIDLSVGSMLALVGGIAAIILADPYWIILILNKIYLGSIAQVLLDLIASPTVFLLLSVFSALIIGFIIGLFNGFLTTYGNIPAFIVTLGGLLAWRGAIKGISRSETIPISNEYYKAIGQNYIPYEIGWILGGILVAGIIFFVTYKIKNKLFAVLASIFGGVFVGYLVPSIYFWLGTNYLIYGFTRNQSLVFYSFILLLAVFFVTTILVVLTMKQDQQTDIVKSSKKDAFQTGFYGTGITLFVMIMSSYEGIPIAVLIFIAIAFLGFFITNNTTFGRYIYAIGGNAEAARLSGINNKKIVLMVFAILGVFVGIASLINTARVAAATPDAGTLLELDAIAACVIGGTSLMGGRGTVFGACLGALIMSSLDNGMSLLNYADYTQELIKGSILVAAVGIDMIGRKS